MATQTETTETRTSEESTFGSITSAYFPYLMSAPSFLWVMIVVGFPTVYLVYLSFTRNALSIIRPVEFVGLENITQVLGSPDFWTIVAQTWVYAIGVVGIGLPFQILLTLGLNADLPYKRVWQALIILPWAIPFVISTLIWRLMFNPQFGLINWILLEIGLVGGPINWFSSQPTAFFTVIITTIWINTPLAVLILLAGLQTIPDRLYEAARIDGAGIWGRFRHVTLPLLRPAIVTVLMIQSLLALRGFDIIFAMTNGGPGQATTVIAIDVYRQLVRYGKTSYASAESLVLIIMILIVLAVLLTVTSKEYEEV